MLFELLVGVRELLVEILVFLKLGVEVHADVVGRQDDLLRLKTQIGMAFQLLQGAFLELDRTPQLDDLLLVVGGHLVQFFLCFVSDLVHQEYFVRLLGLLAHEALHAQLEGLVPVDELLELGAC